MLNINLNVDQAETCFHRLVLFLTLLCSFGPETEKIVLEAGNGLPSWKFNDQLFPCDVCGKVFGRQQTLSRHLSLHTGESGPSPSHHWLLHDQESVFLSFPGGPVVKTPCFQSWGVGSLPGQGTRVPHATWCGQKKKIFFLIKPGSGINVFILTFSSHFTWHVQIRLWKVFFICTERIYCIQGGLMRKDLHLGVFR